MTRLEKLIKETKNEGARMCLLLLQQTYNEADQDEQTFIDVMLLFCGGNYLKQKSSIHICIGKIINDNTFESMLSSYAQNPLLMITCFKETFELIIQGDRRTIVSFNLADIKIKTIKVLSNAEENLVRYLFQLHSVTNDIDYQVVATAQEVN